MLLLTLEYVSRDRCRDSSLYWTCVYVGVFFANSSAKLNIPQPGGHLTTCSSSIEHVTMLCGFTLTPPSGIRQEYAQFARPLGMEELRQGLITYHIFQFRFVHSAQYCHSIWLFAQFYFAVVVHVVRWSLGNALVGEFLVSFLLVFTVFRTAVNSDSFTRRR